MSVNNDLISRSAAVELLREKAQHYTVSMFLTSRECNVARLVAIESAAEISNMSAVEAVEAEAVRHGRWIPLWRNLFALKGFKCSECGHVEKSDGWVYCHCGAKMDLEVE